MTVLILQAFRWSELIDEYVERKFRAEAAATTEIWTPVGAGLNLPVPGHAYLSGEAPTRERVSGEPNWKEERYVYDDRERLRVCSWYTGGDRLSHEEFVDWDDSTRLSVMYGATPELKPLYVTKARYADQLLRTFERSWGPAAAWEKFDLEYNASTLIGARQTSFTPEDGEHSISIEYTYDRRGRIKQLTDGASGQRIYPA